MTDALSLLDIYTLVHCPINKLFRCYQQFLREAMHLMGVCLRFALKTPRKVFRSAPHLSLSQSKWVRG